MSKHKQKQKKLGSGSKSNFNHKQLHHLRISVKNNQLEKSKITQTLSSICKNDPLTLNQKRITQFKPTNLNTPQKVPDSIKKLLKIEQDILPKSSIICILNEYFIDNNLINMETKEIIPSRELKKVFCMKSGDKINYSNIQSWLRKVYGGK